MNKLLFFFFVSTFSVSVFSQKIFKTESETDSTFFNIKEMLNRTEPDSSDFDFQQSLAAKPGFPEQENKITWHSWLTNIPKDYVRFYDIATHTSFSVYFSIAASTAFFMATDNHTWLLQHGWYKSSNFLRQASDRFGEMGDGRTQFALTGIFVGWGLLFKDERAIRTGSQILQVTISSGAFVQVLKHLTGRESPIVSTQPAGEWKFFPSPLAYHRRVPAYDAYPSGHLTTMLGMIIVISENYPEWKWVKPVGYTLSTLMALGMVNNGIHWYSDYPLAIFLGYEFGKIVSHPENYNSDSEKDRVAFNIMPYYSFTGTGLSLQLKF